MSKATAMKRPPIDDSNYAAWFWHRQAVADRIRALDNIEQDAEVVFAPFLNDKLANVMLRMRDRLGDAIDTWEQDQFERAEILCGQVEGSLNELCSIVRETGIPLTQYCDRVLGEALR